MRRHLLSLACVSVLVLVLGGTAATAASSADFRATATAACVHYDRATNALPQITSASELRRQLTLVPRLFRTMVDRIAVVRAPEAQRVQAARLVTSLRQVQGVLAKIRDAFLRGDQAGVQAAVRAGTQPSRIAARAATALRLPTCARLALAAAKGAQP